MVKKKDEYNEYELEIEDEDNNNELDLSNSDDFSEDQEDQSYSETDDQDEAYPVEDQEEEVEDKQKKKRKKKTKEQKPTAINRTQKFIILGGVGVFVVVSLFILAKPILFQGGGSNNENPFSSENGKPFTSSSQENNVAKNTDEGAINPINNQPVNNQQEVANLNVNSSQKPKEEANKPIEKEKPQQVVVRDKNYMPEKGNLNEMQNYLGDIEEQIQNIQHDVQRLSSDMEYYFNESNKQIAQVASLIKNNMNNNSDVQKVNEAKLEEIQEKNKKYEQKIAKLKDRVEELDGKYGWATMVYRKEKKKREKLEKQLEKQKEVSKKVFSDWEIVGMSDTMAVLTSKSGNQVEKLRVGDIFQGSKVEKINLESGKVFTTAGIMEYKK